MQTFLPYSDFKASAKVLDNKRLGKQRVEVLQILKALTEEEYGWKNHPATKMWKGYERALAKYGIVVCEEWISRGFKDTCLPKIASYLGKGRIAYPPWLGNKRFHTSHKSNLVSKYPEYYRKFWPKLSDKLPYVWPVS